jgi:mannitol-1-/sugar-/sorbitol-6-phosphatase
MTRLQCAAILFDLDGVLVDSTPSVVRVWTEWAERNHIAPSKVLEIVHGRRTKEVIQILTPDADINAEAYKVEDGISRQGVQPISGAARLLASLPDDRWCVVTSGIGKLARDRLRVAGLPIPRVLVSADDVANGKPHPEPFLKGARMLGANSEDCLVIEDALNGIQAAHAGGMKVIGLATTYSASELKEADAVVLALEAITVSSVSGEIVLDLR